MQTNSDPCDDSFSKTDRMIDEVGAFLTTTTASTTSKEGLSFKSCIDTAQAVVRWDIEKLSSLCPREAIHVKWRNVDSPSHVTTIVLDHDSCPGLGKPATIDVKWHLSLLWQPATQGHFNHIHVKLVLEDQHLLVQLWSIAMKVSVMGRDLLGWDNLVMFESSAAVVSAPQQAIGAPQLMLLTSKELWDDEQIFVVNDTLRLKVELTFSHQPYSKKLGAQQEPQAPNGEEIIATMTELWRTGKDADVTICCAERVFKIHSLIIKARSPVLERMLDCGMLESANKSIRIDDAEPAHFATFLEYLYTGKIPEPRSAPMFIGLMQVADKYQVLKLKDHCFDGMVENISFENAGEMAVLAYLHEAKAGVRAKIVSFCHENWEALSLSADVNFKLWTQRNPAAFLPA